MQFHALRIAEVTRETTDCVSLTFDIPAALRAEFAFRPGQYLTLRTHRNGEELRRAYSICAGLDDEEIRVAIKRADPGGFSEWANTALGAGEVIDVMPPEGGFGLAPDPAARRTVLAIAAGSGITPVLSIIKSVLARELGSQVILLYGSRSTADIIFRAALEDLKDRFVDRFTLIHVLSREAQDIGVLNGRIDAGKLAALLPGLAEAGDIDAAFLCGPTDMLNALPAVLQAWGVPEGRIHTERFTPSGPRRLAVAVAADSPAFATATIIYDGRLALQRPCHQLPRAPGLCPRRRGLVCGRATHGAQPPWTHRCQPTFVRCQPSAAFSSLFRYRTTRSVHSRTGGPRRLSGARSKNGKIV